MFWPDIHPSESAFVHRIAIRRAYSRSELSSIMMRWAIAEALRHQRKFLRLDCEASCPKLRAIYEEFGFKHRDDRKVAHFMSPAMRSRPLRRPKTAMINPRPAPKLTHKSISIMFISIHPRSRSGMTCL